MGRFLTLLGVLGALALGLARFGDEVLSSGAPQRHGELELPDLAAPVEVRFDAQGIPHVQAESTDDLAVALGYLHANDRAFQMELTRRFSRGRLAELFGEIALETDLETRRLGLAAVAERSVASASERSRRWIEGYTRGVNAWFRQRGDDLPPEFRALRLRPEPWLASDSALVGLGMARRLSSPGSAEVGNARWLEAVGAERLAELLGVESVHVPQGLEEELARLAESASGADADGAPERGYSNNFAVGSRVSSSEGALLAGDPHLWIALPSQFYMARLAAPGFDAFGATLPGLPGIVIGRSAHRAWSLTTTGLDSSDWTLEELNEDGTAVRRPNGWSEIAFRTERVEVAGGTAVERRFGVTDRGPLFEADEEGELLERIPRSLSWTALEGGDALDLFLSLVEDPDAGTVRSAASAYVAPAQNLLCAEADGTLWYMVIGRAPRRAGGDGRLPAFGRDAGYGWRGLEPHTVNPLVTADREGRLATANDDIRPDGEPADFFASWAPPDRGRRIRERLTAAESFDLDALMSIQLDRTTGLAARLSAALGPADAGGNAEAARVIEQLARWDGRVEGGSGALFCLVLGALGAAVLDEDAPTEELAGPQLRVADDLIVRLLEGRVGDAWFDVVETEELEGRLDVVPGALARALEIGRGLFGTDDFESWDLGAIQTLTIEHPLASLPVLGERWSRGPYRLAGHESTPSAVWRRWTGEHFEVIGGASLRFGSDLSDGRLTRHVQPGGQSGHPADPHYTDQVGTWLAGESFDAPWEAPDLDPRRTLRLLPGPVEAR